MSEVVLVVPDSHAPFTHRDALKFVLAVKAKFKPTDFVHLGDEMDMSALSNYDHDPDGLGASEEFERGMKDMEKWYEIFPRMKICTSNHTARPFRRAQKFGIPSVFLREYRDFMRAPKGWEWRDKWEVDDVAYIHGEGFSGPLGALKAAQGFMQSTCIGHIHSDASIVYNANSKHLYFGFNVGCLIDRHAYAFAYCKHQTKKPILGCGIVNAGVPVFIPMLLNNSGRWIGQI